MTKPSPNDVEIKDELLGLNDVLGQLLIKEKHLPSFSEVGQAA